MAEGQARSLDRPQLQPERRVHLRIVARSDDDTGSAKPMPLSAPSMPPPVLSLSSDIYGIGRGGWLAAGALYAALAAALVLIAWRATPPEPWPASETVFRVIFEEPAPAAPAPPPAPEPAQSAPPEPAAAPPPEPVPPQLAEPEPAPLLSEPEPQRAEPVPTAVALPKPPPSKPVIRRRLAAIAPARPAPSAAPAEPRAAALTPPVSAAPVIPPRPITGLASNPKPDYPAEARRRRQQGRVVLHVDVSPTGAPLKVTVASSSGYALLDQAAIKAVERWGFTPATRSGGATVAGAVDVPVQFRLED